MDANLVTAWATVVIAAVTAVALWHQIRASSRALSAELTLRLEDRFNSESMKEARRRAALYLQSLLLKLPPDDDEGLSDVLDFFETIGLLVQRKALDQEMAWHTFFWWLRGYRCAANDYIRKERQEDPTRWTDLDHLYTRFMGIEKCSLRRVRRVRTGDVDMLLSEEDLKRFLEDEASVGIVVRG